MADTKMITEEDIQKQRELVSKLEANMHALQTKVPETKKKIDSLSEKIEMLKKKSAQFPKQTSDQFSEIVPVFTHDSEYEKYKKQYEMVQNDAEIVVLEQKLRQAELASIDSSNSEVDHIRDDLDKRRQYNQRHLDWLKQQMDNHSKTVDMSQVERIIARYEAESSEEDKAFLDSLSVFFTNLPNLMVNVEEENINRQFEEDVKAIKERCQKLRDEMDQIQNEDSAYKEYLEKSQQLSSQIKEIDQQIEDAVHAQQKTFLLTQDVKKSQVKLANLMAKQAELKDPNSFEYVDTNNQIENIKSQLESLNESLSYFSSLNMDALTEKKQAILQRKEKLNYTPSPAYLELQNRYQTMVDKLNKKYQDRAKTTKGNLLERLKQKRNSLLDDIASLGQTLNTVSGAERNKILKKIRSKNAELEKCNNTIVQLNNPETLESLKARSESLSNQIKQIKNRMSTVGISTEARASLANELQTKSAEKSGIEARISTIQSMMVQKNPIQIYRELRKRVEQAREDADFMYPTFYQEEKLLHKIEEKAFQYYTHQKDQRSSAPTISTSGDTQIDKLEEQLEQLQEEHSKLIGDSNIAKVSYDDAMEQLNQMIARKNTSGGKDREGDSQSEFTQKRWECKGKSITPSRLLKRLPLVGNLITNTIYPKINSLIERKRKLDVDRLNKAQAEHDNAKSDYLRLVDQYNQMCDAEDIVKQIIDKKKSDAEFNRVLKNMTANIQAQYNEIFKMYNNACILLRLPKCESIDKFDMQQAEDMKERLKGQKDKRLQKAYSELYRGKENYDKGKAKKEEQIGKIKKNQEFIQCNLTKLGIPLDASIDDLYDRYEAMVMERVEQDSRMRKVEKQWIEADDKVTKAKSNGRDYYLVDGDPAQIEPAFNNDFQKGPLKNVLSHVANFARKNSNNDQAETMSADTSDEIRDASSAQPEKKDVISRISQFAKHETTADTKVEAQSAANMQPEKKDVISRISQLAKHETTADTKIEAQSDANMQPEKKDVISRISQFAKHETTADTKIEAQSGANMQPEKKDAISRISQFAKSVKKQPSGKNAQSDNGLASSSSTISKEIADAISGPSSALDAAAKELSGSSQQDLNQTLKKYVDSLSSEELAQIESKIDGNGSTFNSSNPNPAIGRSK